MLWYPIYGHPDGSNQDPYFHVRDSFAYATDFNPGLGDRVLPWFAIDEELVFPAGGNAVRESVRPWYTIAGSMLYPTDYHPGARDSSAPWYQQRS